jgi:hypothetical protein
MAGLIEVYERALPTGAWPNWVLGNHDRSRAATRLGRDEARVAAMLLLRCAEHLRSTRATSWACWTRRARRSTFRTPGKRTCPDSVLDGTPVKDTDALVGRVAGRI